jgi:pyochelin biosynthesis protein PchD
MCWCTCPNGAAFIEVCFALFRLGARPILALPAHRQHEIGGFCGFAQASAYIGCAQLEGFDCRSMARRLAAANPLLRHVVIDGDAQEFTALSELYNSAPLERDAGRADAVACFQLSGGTTGTPKLIPRRHAEYLYNVRASSEVCELDARTVYLTALPMAHNFTLCCPGVIGTLLAGGRVVCTRRSDPESCFALISEQRVTVTALVPAAGDALAGRPGPAPGRPVQPARAASGRCEIAQQRGRTGHADAGLHLATSAGHGRGVVVFYPPG